MLVEKSGTGDLVAFVVRYMSCSACHHAYSAGDVAIVRHSAGCWLLSAVCPACQHDRAISAFDHLPYTRIPDMGAVRPPLLTRGDVRGWADFLAGFEGDLAALLASAD